MMVAMKIWISAFAAMLLAGNFDAQASNTDPKALVNLVSTSLPIKLILDKKIRLHFLLSRFQSLPGTLDHVLIHLFSGSMCHAP
jgi:hypothetical protein